METKQDIRKEVFRRRKQASPAEIQTKSSRIAAKIFALREWKEAACIYAYMDFNKEVITREIIEKAWETGKQVAVPRVHGDDLVFYIITDFGQCEEGYFGIPEPRTDLPRADWENALMIVPGVAFDPMRHRVGYGKGFYDRYLSVHRGHFTAAVAFSWQVFEEVPSETCVILPRYLVTETDVYQEQKG